VRNQYLEYLRGVRNLSLNTVASYSKDMDLFYGFLSDKKLSEEDLSIKGVREFVAELSARHLSSRSINRIISCIRGYYRFKQRYGYSERNPFGTLKMLKTERWLPGFMLEKEITTLTEAPIQRFLDLRDRFLIEFLYSTGCRVGELVALNANDLDLKEGAVKVMGKGRKERIVYIGKKARSLATEYLLRKAAYARTLPREDKVTQALFINSRGGRLSSRGVRVALDRLLAKVRLPKHVSPHTFRHTFATHILNRGADIRVVQELLGHASLSTTQVYTHLGVDRLKDIYRHAHPHARLGEKVSEERGKKENESV